MVAASGGPIGNNPINPLDSLAKEGISMHYLCTWHDVLAAAKAGKYFTPEAIASVYHRG